MMGPDHKTHHSFYVTLNFMLNLFPTEHLLSFYLFLLSCFLVLTRVSRCVTVSFRVDWQPVMEGEEPPSRGLEQVFWLDVLSRDPVLSASSSVCPVDADSVRLRRG